MTASWWMRAKASAACDTSSSTPTSCCAPDSNMQPEGELSTRQHASLWEMWSAVHIPRYCNSYRNVIFAKTLASSEGACICSRKQDQYRFSWYLPLAGLRLRWVADQERPPDTTVRLLSLRAKMFLLRQQLEQNVVRVL